MPRRKSPDTERRWREIVARQVRSGRSIREFCETEGVADASFYHWRRKLRLGAAARGGRPSGAAAVERDFVPLAVLEPTAALEILHPLGYRVRVTGDVSAAAIRRVLRALEQGDAE